jgi:hypothetical protein
MRSFGRSALVVAAVALTATAAAIAGGPTTVSASYTVGVLAVPGSPAASSSRTASR